ncbi:hypothetical protein [Riemerella anatipestifer]|nr:hypothetical protein [Riemerella anatipestifer]MDR7750998.1 hypothetical protein [Riemerella anatipestifer]MDR7753133.1 hypothetical protein [Riemerella anatipestifer]MDR7755145.1 hypothetical protein [Riemerella anatipestifer]MDR7759281.1 hypothetical protein [Riemerella anatipestifer]MDR7765458.1 hypothetical protein [Riemerella anatipestifer]
MKKIILPLLMIILLNSCKEKIKNPYFTSDEVYNKIIETRCAF